MKKGNTNLNTARDELPLIAKAHFNFAQESDEESYHLTFLDTILRKRDSKQVIETVIMEKLPLG